MEEKQAILVPCPNPYPTGSVNAIKQLFYTTKWGMILIVGNQQVALK